MTPEEKREWELMRIDGFLYCLRFMHDEAMAESYANLKTGLVVNKTESNLDFEHEKAAYLKLIKDLIRFLADSKEKMGFEKDEYDAFVSDLL